MNNESNASKTFAETVLNMLQAHKQSEITIFISPFGGLEIQMNDYSKEHSRIGAKHIIPHEAYDISRVSIDEIMTFTLQHLRKELDNYGSKS